MHPLIIGAGPAGCSAALALHAAGGRPRIVERARVVGDAICGGFMSWQTLAALGTIGIDGEALGGHALTQVVVFAGKRRACAALPGPAIGVSRRRLDTMLQAHVARAGLTIERGIDVRSIAAGNDGAVAVHTGDGACIGVDTVFLASGKHDVRGFARPRHDPDPTLGLRLRIGPSPALRAMVGDAIELHLSDRAYIGINLQEDGSANVCLAVRKSRLAEAGGRPDRLLCELGRDTPLGDRLGHADGQALDAIAAVPYGWRARDTVPGLYRLGDQAAVIPSLAGEGIGIAVASGIAAAAAFRCGVSASSYQRAFARRTRRPVTAARWLWTAAEHAALARLAVPLISAMPGLARLGARVTRIGD